MHDISDFVQLAGLCVELSKAQAGIIVAPRLPLDELVLRLDRHLRRFGPTNHRNIVTFLS